MIFNCREDSFATSFNVIEMIVLQLLIVGNIVLKLLLIEQKSVLQLLLFVEKIVL